MTLSGKYKQYDYPGLESKANGISNLAEEHSLNDDCSQFPEVYFYYDLQITLGIMAILALWATDIVCLHAHWEYLLVSVYLYNNQVIY
jgi:hypothetical protein